MLMGGKSVSGREECEWGGKCENRREECEREEEREVRYEPHPCP